MKRFAAPALLVAVGSLMVLTGCGSASPDADPKPATVTVTATPTPTATPSPTATPTETPAARHAVVPASRQGFAFVTPSGNIACNVEGVDDPSGSADARCDIAEHTYTEPARPHDCPLAYGDSVELDQRAMLLCHGDTIADQAAIPGSGSADLTTWFDPDRDPTVTTKGTPRLRLAALSYGDSITYRTITCTSAASGVSCRDSRTGHGFSLARAAYRLR